MVRMMSALQLGKLLRVIDTQYQNQEVVVKIHLIPYDETIKNSKKEKVKRNQHVLHLPKYTKITQEDIAIFNDICSVCQGEYKEGEYMRELPFCKHKFHKRCIDRWLLNDEKMSCPVCRTPHHEKYF